MSRWIRNENVFAASGEISYALGCDSVDIWYRRKKEELYYAGPSEGMIIERRLTANACDEEPPAPESVCCDGE